MMKPGPAGLICRTEQVVTDLSGRHWMEECNEPTMHPALLEADLYDHKQGHSYHASLDCLSVTEVLGKVRETAIKCSLPYWPEAQGLNSREFGTAVGMRTQKGWKLAGWKTQVMLAGEFWGIPFRGTLDACTVADGVRYIDDDKVTSAENLFRLKSSFVASKEFSAQIGMYGLMKVMPHDGDDVEKWDEFCAEWEAATKTRGLVWNGALLKVADKSGQLNESWHRQNAEPLGIEEIANLRPAGSQSTVRQNAEALWKFKQAVKKGETPEERHKIAIEAIKEIGLWCASMYGGACRGMCDANRTCLRLAGVPLASKAIIEVRIPWEEHGL